MADTKAVLGLVLSGTVRSVGHKKIRPESGEAFLQLTVYVDGGDPEFIYQVAVPREDEARYEASLKQLVGEQVSLKVGAGNFRKLYLQGIL